jgi:hypothetical protein
MYLIEKIKAAPQLGADRAAYSSGNAFAMLSTPRIQLDNKRFLTIVGMAVKTILGLLEPLLIRKRYGHPVGQGARIFCYQEKTMLAV